MKQYLFAFLFVFILAFILSSYLQVYASVVLNEVAVQPNQAVELINIASTSADISGWYIDDSGGTTYYTIPPQTLLAPQSCYVFTGDFNFNKSSPDTVRLFNNSYPPTSSSAAALDSYMYVKAPDAGYSFEKKIDGGAEWQTNYSSFGLYNESLVSCIPTPTPTPTLSVPTETPAPLPTPTSPAEVLHEGGSPTPTPLPIDYSNIFISEVFPSPATNEHEWIELYNGNDSQACLTNWYIDDGENTGGTPKAFSLCLDAYAYGAVDLSSSLFNNTGDTARLLNADRAEKDSMEYSKIAQEKSMGRTSFESDDYCEQEPSKNSANTNCIAQLIPTSGSRLTLSTASPSKKVPTPTKKPKNEVSSPLPIMNSASKKTTGSILGAQSNVQSISTSSPPTPYPLNPIPYLSSVSLSYSLLTIVSVLIKMKNA